MGASNVTCGPTAQASSAGNKAQSKPAASVRVTRVDKGELVLRRSYPAEVVAEQVELSPRTSGHVEAIEVELGQELRAGQVVARIKAPEVQRKLLTARSRERVAQHEAQAEALAMRSAQREYDVALRLHRQSAIGDSELEALRAKAQLMAARSTTARSRVELEFAQLSQLREELAERELVARGCAHTRAGVDGQTLRRPVIVGLGSCGQ